MTTNTLAQAMLVEFAVREAGTDASLDEMKAICYALRNRVRAGWHGGDWIACMEAAGESAGNERLVNLNRIEPQNRPLQMLLMQVEDIFFGARQQPDKGWGGEKVDPDAQGDSLEAAIGTALYWVHIKREIRPWFVENIIRDHQNHPERTSLGLWRFHK